MFLSCMAVTEQKRQFNFRIIFDLLSKMEPEGDFDKKVLVNNITIILSSMGDGDVESQYFLDFLFSTFDSKNKNRPIFKEVLTQLLLQNDNPDLRSNIYQRLGCFTEKLPLQNLKEMCLFFTRLNSTEMSETAKTELTQFLSEILVPLTEFLILGKLENLHGTAGQYILSYMYQHILDQPFTVQQQWFALAKNLLNSPHLEYVHPFFVEVTTFMILCQGLLSSEADIRSNNEIIITQYFSDERNTLDWQGAAYVLQGELYSFFRDKNSESDNSLLIFDINPQLHFLAKLLDNPQVHPEAKKYLKPVLEGFKKNDIDIDSPNMFPELSAL